MSDVLKIALERRNRLHDDIKKLDEFIRMADALMRGEEGLSRPATHSAPTVPTIPMPVDSADSEIDESPMRTAARKLSDTEVRRAPENDSEQGDGAARPSIIRRGLAG